MRAKKSLHAGLHISEHSIKLLLLEKDTQGFHIHTQTELQPDELIQLKKYKLPALAISIPNETVLSNTTVVDMNASDDEIEMQLNEEIPKLFPNINADLYFDFCILETHQEQKIKKILVLAANRELIEEKITLLTNIGIHVHTLEMSGYALLRGLHYIDTPHPQRVMIIHFNEPDIELILKSTFIIAHQKITWQPNINLQTLTNTLTQAIHFLNASSRNFEATEILLISSPPDILEQLNRSTGLPTRAVSFARTTIKPNWLTAFGLALRHLI